MSMRRLWAGLIFIGFIFVFPNCVWAQDASSLTGVVIDQNGAVVPGAEVVLQNPETGLTYQATTNATGSYTIAQIKPGPGYTLKFSHAGFSPFAVSGLYLNVDSTRVQNGTLRVGGGTESVEVSASEEGITINSTDATIGNNFEVQQLNELPVQDRSKPSALFVQQPGTTLDGSVTGARVDQNRVTVDGLDVNDLSTGNFGTIVASAPVDSVQEFRGVTGGLQSSANGGGGGQYELVTRSGTNTFHGALVEYHRDASMEANDWFNNASGVRRPPLVRNQFGGNFGGPILKNKLFVFFDYNGRRDTLSSLVNRIVPLDSFRNGSLNYLNANGAVSTLNAGQVAALDPKGVGFNPGLQSLFSSRYPHSNNSDIGDGLNTGGVRFNAPFPYVENDFIQRVDFNLNEKMKFFGRGSFSRINGTNQAVWFPGDPATYPSIDRSYAWVGSFVWVLSDTKINQVYLGEVHQDFSTQDTFNPTGATQYQSEFGGGGTGQPIIAGPYGNASGGTALTFPVPLVRDNFNWQAGRHSLSFGGVFKWPKPSTLRVSNYNIPFIGLGGNLTSLDATLRPADICPSSAPASQCNAGATHLYDPAFALALAPFSATSAGFSYNAQGSPIPQGTGLRRTYQFHETELYFGDTWKVTPKLTASYGLRWVNYTAPYEVHGIESIQNFGFDKYFAARLTQSAQSQSGNLAVPLISYNLGGHANHAPDYFKTSYKDFGPRLALAYAVKPTLVFNGGIGIIDDETVINAVQSQQANFDYLFQSGATAPLETAGSPRGALAGLSRFTAIDSPVAPPPAPATATRPYYPFVSGSGSSAVPNGLINGLAFNTSIDPNLKTPYSIQYNVGFQDQLPKGLLLKISYVGRQGRRLLAQADANQIIDYPDPASGQMYSAAMASVTTQLRMGVSPLNVTPQPWFEHVLFPGSGIGQGYANNTQLVSAGITGYATFGDFGDLTQTLASFGALPPNVGMASQFSQNTFFTNKGFSGYNGLLVTLHKNMGSGLQFDLNYTWSHSIDNVSARATLFAAGTNTGFICDAVHPRECRGNSDFDVTNYLNSNFVYELPVGHGRQFAPSVSRWVDEAIGGWSISGLPYWHTGNAYNAISNAYVASYANDAPAILTGSRSDLTAHVNKNNGLLFGFANPGKAQGDYTGPLGLTFGSRNNLRGPNYFNMDMGLGKTSQILKDKLVLKFRTDAFNVFNHPNFSTPCSDITNSFCTFGVISSTVHPSISTDQSSRVLQLALRLEF